MIEANVEIYEARAAQLVSAATTEGRVLLRFRITRASLITAGAPMTNAQKQGALALLTNAKAKREEAATLVDEAFDATEPIIEETP